MTTRKAKAARLRTKPSKPVASSPAVARRRRNRRGENREAPVKKHKASGNFYIVGLGASAGGLEALRIFFAAVPAQTGAAFIVIQHLAPERESQMAELLATHAHAPVQQIVDGTTIEPDHIYVIPPDRGVKISAGRLLLFQPKKRTPHLLIDTFFRSLADECGELAIGIALSGTGTDGTLGVRAIKEAGGTVMVQDEESAKFSGMPDSAGATGLADYVLPPAEIAGELLKFIRHPFVAPAKDPPLKVSDVTLHNILGLIRTQTGIDFCSYKQSTVMRRIDRRIRIAQLANASDYLELLQQSQQEVAALGRDLLINVTRFFRDAEVFAALRDEILPAILKTNASERKLRIWVPGCARGEEAYSIAMLVQELVAARGDKWDVKIFATDIDQASVEFASRGFFPKMIARDLTPEMLARFFVEQSGGWRIAREIREQVVFAQHNILHDPPFTKTDLISCRNLLIYLRAESQNKVIALLHFGLRPEGYLLLGTSEAIGDREDAFETVNAKMRIFKKRTDSRSLITQTVTAPAASSRTAGVMRESASSGRAFPASKPPETIWETVTERLMAEFGATCLILNEKHHVLHSFGQPQRFLTLHPGETSLSILKLLPRPLSRVLATALRRSSNEHQRARHAAVRLSDDNGSRFIDLKIEPLPAEPEHAGRMLVVFQEAKSDLRGRRRARMAELEEDLERVSESLQMATESRETTQEELQASNEELLAGNEELQSSNEELESVNEELTKLNAEYQKKIAELIVSNNDLENFLRTSDVATIFLDETLRVRRFTPAVTQEIPLQRSDVGRLLTECAHPLIAAIADDLVRVEATGSTVMKDIETGPNIWHLVRVTPYRREGASDRGFVVTILDISELHRSDSGSAQ